MSTTSSTTSTTSATSSTTSTYLGTMKLNASSYNADTLFFHNTTSHPSARTSKPASHSAHPAWKLPLDMLSSYWDYKDTTNHASALDLIKQLYTITSQVHSCYKYIELVYGVRDCEPWPNNDAEVLKPFNQQRHPELRLHDVPQYYVDVLPNLYWVQQQVEKEMDKVHTAYIKYEADLHSLYLSSRSKREQRLQDLGGDGQKLRGKMGEEALNALKKLERKYRRPTVPGYTYNPNCIADLRKFWRTLGGKEDRKPLERAWEWVAGKELVLD